MHFVWGSFCQYRYTLWSVVVGSSDTGKIRHGQPTKWRGHVTVSFYQQIVDAFVTLCLWSKPPTCEHFGRCGLSFLSTLLPSFYLLTYRGQVTILQKFAATSLNTKRTKGYIARSNIQPPRRGLGIPALILILSNLSSLAKNGQIITGLNRPL